MNPTAPAEPGPPGGPVPVAWVEINVTVHTHDGPPTRYDFPDVRPSEPGDIDIDIHDVMPDMGSLMLGQSTRLPELPPKRRLTMSVDADLLAVGPDGARWTHAAYGLPMVRRCATTTCKVATFTGDRCPACYGAPS